MQEEQPDPDLNAELDRLAGRGWRRIAAASIDLGSGTPARLAVLGADTRGYFEIGSVTKALTGMLLAVAVQRDELGLDSTVGDVAPDLRNTEVAQAGRLQGIAMKLLKGAR
jgi:CubicO group peptidase (beta-lactamase class C family)